MTEKEWDKVYACSRVDLMRTMMKTSFCNLDLYDEMPIEERSTVTKILNKWIDKLHVSDDKVIYLVVGSFKECCGNWKWIANGLSKREDAEKVAAFYNECLIHNTIHEWDKKCPTSINCKNTYQVQELKIYDSYEEVEGDWYK